MLLYLGKVPIISIYMLLFSWQKFIVANIELVRPLILRLSYGRMFTCICEVADEGTTLCTRNVNKPPLLHPNAGV